jgi:hypothetical protein
MHSTSTVLVVRTTGSDDVLGEQDVIAFKIYHDKNLFLENVNCDPDDVYRANQICCRNVK